MSAKGARNPDEAATPHVVAPGPTGVRYRHAQKDTPVRNDTEVMTGTKENVQNAAADQDPDLAHDAALENAPGAGHDLITAQ